MSGASGFMQRMLRALFGVPAHHPNCKATVAAADRIEHAAKRIEDAADEFGQMASDMRGRRRRRKRSSSSSSQSAKKKTAKEPRASC